MTILTREHYWNFASISPTSLSMADYFIDQGTYLQRIFFTKKEAVSDDDAAEVKIRVIPHITNCSSPHSDRVRCCTDPSPFG